MKTTKRILSLLLCMALILGIVPIFAAAEEATATITFDNTSKRTEFDTSHQVWVENGVTVTNNKAASTSNVANYSKPARFYASSQLIVAYDAPITQIVFDCNSPTYATALKNSIGSPAGATVTVASDKVTVAFTETVTSFTIAKLTAQVRMDGLTITYNAAAVGCEHANLGEASHIGGEHSAICADCQEVIVTEDEVTSTFTEENHTVSCTCGYTATEAHTLSDWTVKTPASYTAPGEEIKTCSSCEYVVSQEIAQLVANGAHYIKYESETLLSGTYILIAGSYAMGAYDASGWILNTQPPVIDDTTVTDDMGGVWTLTVTDAGVILTDANGKTVAPKSGEQNGILANDYVWAWEYDAEAGTYTFSGQGSDKTRLALNIEAKNGQNRFRAYKLSTLTGTSKADYVSTFNLYKLEGEVSCDHNTVYTTTATTHIAACSKCQEVFVEESYHDLKGENGTCSVCGEVVDVDALTAAWLEQLFALESGATLDGSFTLTGTVTAINYAFDASYKNMTVTIAIEGYEETVQCYRMKCTADQAAAIVVGSVITVEGSFKNYNGTYEVVNGTLLSIYVCEHEYDNVCDADCNLCGETRVAPHEYDDNCDFDCNICEEFRSAPHNLGEAIPAKVPANCLETGYNEHWICADCGCYFMSDGMGGYYETNPAWMNYAGEHVRPEGAAECAVVTCTLCGEDSYGSASCDRGNAPACQDATCINCGGVVYGEGHSYGYDEETWEPLAPFCQAGDCIHCGQHLDYIYECENGSYAPCSVDGECVYGCGKQFPATGIHELDNPCEGGLCWMCWEEIEGAHNYVDGVCTGCGATTGPEKADDLIFMQAPSLSFQDYIGMQVMINSALLNNYDEIYVEAIQMDPEKGAVTTKLNGFLYFFDMFYVFDQQILSWSMAENVTLTLYGVKDGKTFVGQSYSASVEDLALGMLASNATDGDAKLCTVLVNMLNYGATVQTTFEHNETLLPNTKIADYASFGTAGVPAMDASVKISGNGAIASLQDSISMQSKVELQLLFAADISAYTGKAVVNGVEKNVVFDTETMGAYGWTVVRVAVGAAEMRETFTIALYDAEGNAVTNIYEVSVEAYAKGLLGGTQNDVAVTMMRYGDAVAAFAAN